MKFIINDGGRFAAGFKGNAGDCVTRAVAIASGKPYAEVYAALSEGCRKQRVTKRGTKKSSARDGVYTSRKWFKDYMQAIGFEWVPTMHRCTVHLKADELPSGRLVVNVSRHCTAVIGGVIYDNHDPQREGHRCVYGYWARDKQRKRGKRKQ